MPVSYMTAFGFDLGINGLWIGSAVGVGMVISLHLLFLFTMASWDITDTDAINAFLRVRAKNMEKPKLEDPLDATSYEPDETILGTDEEDSLLLKGGYDRPSSYEAVN